VYYFENAGDSVLYCASADWMPRNLIQRVEQCFPMLDPELKERIFKDLELCLADNRNSWIMDANGDYNRPVPDENEAELSAQGRLLAEYRER